MTSPAVWSELGWRRAGRSVGWLGKREREVDTCLVMAAVQASGVVWQQTLRAGGFHVQLAEQKE